MKVLQITRQFSPAIGGIENSVLHLCNALTQQSIDVEILTLDRLWGRAEKLEHEEIINGIKVHRVPFWGPRQYAFAPQAISYLGQYDVIHLHSCDFFLDFSSLNRWWNKSPIVLTTHGFYFHTTTAKGFKWLYFHTITRLSLTQVSRIIAVSNHDFDLARRVVSETKIQKIPNGIPAQYLEIDNSQRKANRILSVGRLSSNKRHDLLIQAFAIAQKAVPDLELVIVGKDQGCIESLRRAVDELDVSEKVFFLGEVSQTELTQLLGQAGIWAMASDYEAFGIGLLEAMSTGCIPVVSGISAHRELIDDGVTGFLTDFHNPARAANCLLRAYRLSSDLRKSMQDLGKQTAGDYTWSQIASKVLNVYKSCV